MEKQFRVSGEAAARRLEHEHHVRDPRTVGDLGKHATPPKVERFHQPGTLEPTSGNGFQFEPSGFSASLNNLTRHSDDFFKQTLTKATELSAELPVGTGPVAEVVGQAFRHRLGDQGGMEYALREHAEHLARVVQLLAETARNYQQTDQQAADTLNSIGDAS